MLSNQHFYHRIIRKMVVSFGSIFNNIKLVRYNQAGTLEVERINVPISYANKEKFYRRLIEDPTLANQTLTVLPRMAFEMTGITYDGLRKISNHQEIFEDVAPNSKNRIRWVPYNFDFNLSIFVRNTEDGTQIVEQILPYFTPDYTVAVDFVSMDGLVLDVPIILNSISYEPDYEGLPDNTRTLIWNLNFTMKGYFFGAINQVSVIRKSTANVYDNIFGTRELQQFEMTNGTGNFRPGELVYQGYSAESAGARAFVRSWSNTTNNLVIYDVSGEFKKNTNTTGYISGATYKISSYDIDPSQMLNITIVPDPITANANNDFGFTETIEEYPDIT